MAKKTATVNKDGVWQRSDGVKGKPAASISRDEWLSAYAEAQGSNAPFDDTALTAMELAAIWQCDDRNARRALAKLRKEGKVETFRKYSRTADGRRYVCPAYKLKGSS